MFGVYFQYQKRMEAERLKQEEEAELRKKMNIKKAKEEAERHHQVKNHFFLDSKKEKTLAI